MVSLLLETLTLYTGLCLPKTLLCYFCYALETKNPGVIALEGLNHAHATYFLTFRNETEVLRFPQRPCT